jgi:hypothetical protein
MQLSRRGALVGGALLLASPARAQLAGERLRGRIVAVEGETLRLVTGDGTPLAVQLGDAPVAALRRVPVAELVPGTRLGVVAEPLDDGLRAVAINVLPATATRDFQTGWDLSPGSSMNNGAVAAVVAQAEGHELALSINGRNVPVRIDARTSIVQPIPATRADLVPGAAVFVSARRGEGGLSATRVTVEKDGVAPAG